MTAVVFAFSINGHLHGRFWIHATNASQAKPRQVQPTNQPTNHCTFLLSSRTPAIQIATDEKSCSEPLWIPRVSGIFLT